jgi:hypothetical protein
MNFTTAEQTVITEALAGRTLGSEHLPAIRKLVRAGLVTSVNMNKRAYPETPGGMVWHKWQQTATIAAYRVTLTQDGKETLGVLF